MLRAGLGFSGGSFCLGMYIHVAGCFGRVRGGTWAGRAVFAAAAVGCTYRCDSHAVVFALLGSISAGIVHSLLFGLLHAVFK